MSNSSNVRSEAKKLVNQIETLAHQVADKLDNGSFSDALSAANELVKNSATFTFVLGSLYQSESTSKKKKSTVATVSTPAVKKSVPAMSRANFHNKRDSRGRFASK